MKNKFIKVRKGRNKGVELKANKTLYYQYGIQAINRGELNDNQIEAARKCIIKSFKKNITLITKIKPNRAKTKKANEVRMGNGKGDIIKYIYNIKPGSIIFELNINDYKMLKIINNKCLNKLPIKTNIFYIDDNKMFQNLQ